MSQSHNWCLFCMKGREALYKYSHNLICLQGPENCKSKSLLLTLLQVLGHHSCHRIKSSYILQPLMIELIYLLSSLQTQPLVNPIFTQIVHNLAIVKATKYSTNCKKDSATSLSEIAAIFMWSPSLYS